MFRVLRITAKWAKVMEPCWRMVMECPKCSRSSHKDVGGDSHLLKDASGTGQ
jgi:hypothetical protein